MLNFKNYMSHINEGWVPPKPGEEPDEVKTQLDAANSGRMPASEHLKNQLNHLSDRNNFVKAVSNSKAEVFTPSKFKNVNNTDAGDPKRAIKGLDAEKLKRVKAGLDKAQTSPIILRHKESGDEHLLAGNTRSTVNAAHGKSVVARIIEY